MSKIDTISKIMRIDGKVTVSTSLEDIDTYATKIIKAIPMRITSQYNHLNTDCIMNAVSNCKYQPNIYTINKTVEFFHKWVEIILESLNGIDERMYHSVILEKKANTPVFHNGKLKSAKIHAGDLLNGSQIVSVLQKSTPLSSEECVILHYINGMIGDTIKEYNSGTTQD